MRWEATTASWGFSGDIPWRFPHCVSMEWISKRPRAFEKWGIAKFCLWFYTLYTAPITATTFFVKKEEGKPIRAGRPCPEATPPRRDQEVKE